MERAVTIEDARKKLGDLVEGARLRGDQYIISKKGKPAAAIVPLEIVKKHKEAKKALLMLIEEVHEKNKAGKSEEIENLIDEAVRWARRRAKA
ncbi:MAG: type II toxin-antitoxin system Phd/YefM family antitoxin [Thermodesulfovibrionales bacterium]|nr:type II toxin-antitoxin system Phd/YefM family antitoxin [Nitrospirota bacterium]MDO8746499.1 type II toxin-antitoxin system Phd/YefM family antitoxin [Thermodesulfovibrionales bacterium]MDP1758503.1 type II toxin-antitoxin system Phd/YefM family antitoxin [Thermodesulfovibrionales bacterium]